MKNNFFKTGILAVLTMMAVGCSKDAQETKEVIDGNGNITIEFHNVFGNEEFRLNTKEYKEQEGEAKFGRLNYIVSNFALIDENGKKTIYPKDESYFMIDERKGLIRAQLKNIPAGNYTKIEFGVGLDEEKNKGDISELGDLLLRTEDHAAMWDWQATPILVMLEGTFKAPNTEEFKKFLLHVGNHENTFHYNTVSLKMPMLKVRKDKTSTLRIKADVEKMINGSDDDHKIKLSEYPYITVNPDEATLLYDNVLKMFEVE